MLGSSALLGVLAMLGFIKVASSPDRIAPPTPVAVPVAAPSVPAAAAAASPPPTLPTNLVSIGDKPLEHPKGFPGDGSCLQVSDLSIDLSMLYGSAENLCDHAIKGGEVNLQVVGESELMVVESHTIFVQDLEPNQSKNFYERLDNPYGAHSLRVARVEAFS